jgi:hypothetical protein
MITKILGVIFLVITLPLWLPIFIIRYGWYVSTVLVDKFFDNVRK